MAKDFEPPKAILAEIEKGPDNKIVVSINTFGTKDYVNVREHWKPEDEADYIPTKKGFTIPTEDFIQLDELIKGLQDARTWLEEHSDGKKEKPLAEDGA